MKSAAHVLAVIVTVVAMTAPTVGAPLRQDRDPQPRPSKIDRSTGVETAFVERQERLWRKLSGSICAGCITSANRVAPVSYERPNLTDLAQAQTARVQVVARKPRAKVKLAYLRKRYARLHRRNRSRIAARPRRVLVTTAAPIRKYAGHSSVSSVLSPGWVGFDTRTRAIPIERPEAPHDDGRRHETILSVSEARPRRS